jgi:two-component system OmpR family sensor kinase
MLTAWQGLLAALWVAIVAVSAYIGSSMRDISAMLDEGRRTFIASVAASEDLRLHASGKSISTIAPIILQKIDTDRDVSAAVVDDHGKFIAGDKAVLAGVVLPTLIRSGPNLGFAGPPPWSNMSTPGTAVVGKGIEPGPNVFGPGGPPPVGAFGLFHQQAMPFGEATTVARLNGGWLVVARKPSSMGFLGSWYWPAAAITMMLSFASVWVVGRRTLVQAVRPMARVERGLRRLAEADGSTVEAIASEDAGLAAPLVESYNAAALELAAVLRQRSELEPRIRQFVADAGHELRTPLAVIMGYVQLLRERSDVDSSMAERVFSEIQGQGERMTLLIQKLLLLTRLESQEPRDVKLLDAAEIAQSVADSFRPLAGQSTIVAHGEPNAIVRASESELRDMIGNLVDNALKYAPGSTIEIEVRLEQDAVSVSVSDNGTGMSPELRARAFERFSRGETAGAIPGSGLGLAIVETAVERAGGTVSLRTAPGQGTVVEMRFPASTQRDSK